jgi:hypothetical protein
MKRPVLRPRKVPLAWSDLGYAALRRNCSDTFDDRVSESLVDGEDEREAVAAVGQAAIRTLN